MAMEQSIVSDEEIGDFLQTNYGYNPRLEDFMLDLMSAAPMLMGFPMSISRPEALKQLAKDFRSIKALKSRPGRLPEKVYNLKTDIASHEGSVYRALTKALKNIPQSELDDISRIGLWRGINAVDDLGRLYSLGSDKAPRLRIRSTQPVDEVAKTLFHEFAHVAQQSPKEAFPIDPVYWEWHAEDFADILSKEVEAKGGKISEEDYYNAMHKSIKKAWE